jgi:riboflavin synthase
MFNGIIHKTARVLAVSDHARGRRLVLAAPWADHQLGESTAINGVCLTVAHIENGTLAYDVIRESLDKTNLGLLRTGDEVHIERSMRVGDPIDGHFVQGHVDGTAKLIEQIDNAHETRLRLEAPAHLAKFLVPKGSIAIDGVSLTLAAVESQFFEVALIPTTLQLTTLGRHQVGYPFNMECDTMAKTIVSYLERFANRSNDVTRATP